MTQDKKENQAVTPQQKAPNTSFFASQLKSFLSGGFGGMCLVMAGHPFDLVKVRLQTSSEYSGMMDCIRKTLARDGFFGLYRGMSAPLIGVTPIFAICFWGYDVGQKIQRWMYNQKPDDPLTLNQIMFAGGFSAIPTTLVMAPGERVKVLLQIQGQDAQKGIPPKYKGFTDVIVKLYKEGGIQSIFKGSVATLLRDVPGSVAYFGAYEVVKAKLSKGGKEALNPLAVLFAGGMAGIANWTVAIPPDVIKSRWQTAAPGEYKNMMEVVTRLLRNEGPQALFKGLGPAMVRAFPANAACFLGVEVSKKLLDKLF
jgi:solute carrier family 25 carnitine/acylcarnitine transporter 20/29